jgi:hypothetical protein
LSAGRAAAASLAAEEGYAPAAALPQRLLHFVLFITVLTSSLAFIEHWDRNRARPAVGEGFPFLLFRSQDGFTVPPWLTFPEAPL